MPISFAESMSQELPSVFPNPSNLNLDTQVNCNFSVLMKFWYVYLSLCYGSCLDDHSHVPWELTEHLIYIAQCLFPPPNRGNPVLPEHCLTHL